jgi:MFS family permease
MRAELRELREFNGFSNVALARFISNVGNGISPIALAYGVLSIPGSDAGDLSLVMSIRYFPMIALMLFGGVIADRYSRKLLVGVTDVIGSTTSAIVAISFISGHAHLWILLVVGAVDGILNALWFPAMNGILPEILPKTYLQKGNAFIGLVSNIGYIVGALSGGIIVATFSPGWGILFDALTFFLAGIIIWRLKVTPLVGDEHKEDSSKGMIHDLVIGWREFISRSWVVAMVFCFAVINLAFESMVQVLGPLNYRDPNSGARSWSYNLAAMTIGMVIGGIIVLKMRFKRPLFIAMIFICISVVWDYSLALKAPLWIAVIAAVISGMTIEIFLVTWFTSLQHHIPEESYSRVAAYDAVGSFGIAPLGIVVAGPLAHHFGVDVMLATTGTLTLVAALASLFVPSVRRLQNDI